MTEGVEAVGLASTTVLLPSAISAKPLDSLDHAYMKLSETFETWRISHTGSIYTRVLYQESSIWYPLYILGNKALNKQEQEVRPEPWGRLHGENVTATGTDEGKQRMIVRTTVKSIPTLCARM